MYVCVCVCVYCLDTLNELYSDDGFALSVCVCVWMVVVVCVCVCVCVEMGHTRSIQYTLDTNNTNRPLNNTRSMIGTRIW